MGHGRNKNNETKGERIRGQHFELEKQKKRDVKIVRSTGKKGEEEGAPEDEDQEEEEVLVTTHKTRKCPR